MLLKKRKDPHLTFEFTLIKHLSYASLLVKY